MRFLRKNFLLILSIILIILGKRLFAGEESPDETAPEDDNSPVNNDNDGDTSPQQPLPPTDQSPPYEGPPWEQEPPITDEDIWDEFGDDVFV